MLCTHIVFSTITFFIIIKIVYGIFGGWFAEEGEYPFAVCFVVGKSNPLCSGSIITTAKILTTADCLLSKFNNIRVVAGVVDVTDKSSDWYQDSNISSKEIHPKYESRGDKISLYNIGIAILKTPFTYTENVKPLTIVSSNKDKVEEIYYGYAGTTEECIIYGWGTTRYDKKDPSNPTARDTSKKLKVAGEVPQLYSDCKFLTKGASFDIRENGITCVFPAHSNSTPCIGDGGGGLVCGEGKHLYALFAEIFECGHYISGVFLLISYYIEDYGLDQNVGGAETVHTDCHMIFVFLFLAIILKSIF